MEVAMPGYKLVGVLNKGIKDITPKLEDSLEGATPVHEFPLIAFINPRLFQQRLGPPALKLRRASVCIL